jgi:hypothetical protein
VKVLSALFAEVLVGTGSFVHDAYAASVLPDFADIALNEKPAKLIGLNVWIHESGHGFGSIRWRPRVLLVATHAAGDLVLFGYVVFGLVVEFRRLVLIVVMLACSSASQRWLGLHVVRRFLGLFRGERVWG